MSPLITPKTTPEHSPALIASTVKVRDVKISPNGEHILYQVQPFYKERKTFSDLWMAQTNIPNSARQLTDGSFNDRSASFHPDGESIFFLSDRHGGKGSHLYSLNIGQGSKGSTPIDLLSRKGVQGFEISPDGKLIAFTSPDELVKTENHSDAKVFSEKSGLSRLWTYEVRTGDVWVLQGIRRDRHIESFSWLPNSKDILYRLRENRGVEYSEREVLVEVVSALQVNATAEPRAIGSYWRSPAGQTLYLSSGHIADLQSFEPRNTLDARTLFIRPEGRGISLEDDDVEKRYGNVDDAVRMTNMRPEFADTDEVAEIAIEVSTGVETSVDVVRFCKRASAIETSTLWRTNNDAVWFGAWDARRVNDSNGEPSYIVAAVLSSGVKHQPPNVWAGRTKFGEIHEMKQLSSHLKWLIDAPAIRTEKFCWMADDEVELDGMIRYPPGYDETFGPLPTVLFIHGGPYRRDIPDYMPYFCNWREMLASAGYLVISPNYRGSQGRGHAFAQAANLGIGVRDWPDCESMVDEVIKRGLADPDHLAVAGWSHGGSLTAWGVTKTKSKFKAAVVGAGVSHWEGMVMESGSPELEAAIGQRVPWDEEEKAVAYPGGRTLSPIHAVTGVTTAVLILHGEKDERVPVGQGIGLWRGLKRKAAQRGREGAELIVYPREPHGFVERVHAEDVMKRVLIHLEAWV